jgi:hypothetical protein
MQRMPIPRETASGSLGYMIIEFQRTSGSEQGTVSFGLLQLIALWAGNTNQARQKLASILSVLHDQLYQQETELPGTHSANGAALPAPKLMHWRPTNPIQPTM